MSSRGEWQPGIKAGTVCPGSSFSWSAGHYDLEMKLCYALMLSSFFRFHFNNFIDMSRWTKLSKVLSNSQINQSWIYPHSPLLYCLFLTSPGSIHKSLMLCQCQMDVQFLLEDSPCDVVEHKPLLFHIQESSIGLSILAFFSHVLA